jgi:hypothetical protein
VLVDLLPVVELLAQAAVAVLRVAVAAEQLAAAVLRALDSEPWPHRCR